MRRTTDKPKPQVVTLEDDDEEARSHAICRLLVVYGSIFEQTACDLWVYLDRLLVLWAYFARLLVIELLMVHILTDCL